MPTEPVWSTTPPSEPGRYWLRDKFSIFVVRIEADSKDHRIESARFYSDWWDGSYSILEMKRRGYLFGPRCLAPDAHASVREALAESAEWTDQQSFIANGSAARELATKLRAAIVLLDGAAKEGRS